MSKNHRNTVGSGARIPPRFARLRILSNGWVEVHRGAQGLWCGFTDRQRASKKVAGRSCELQRTCLTVKKVLRGGYAGYATGTYQLL